MVRLATVAHPFHARVIAARVGAEGILTELRGCVDGLYPSLGDVHVYVPEIDLPVAQELLLADEVESAFDEPDEPRSLTGQRDLWLIMAATLLLATILFARHF
jgi:hypothetical protein